MRTTLTIDDDVAALLRKAMARRKIAFRDVVNEALRTGLTAPRPTPKKVVRTRSHDAGKLLIDLTSVSEALAVAEGEGWP